MRVLRTAEDFVGGYGPTYKTGVLSEHGASFTAAGGRISPAASGSGREWAVLPSGEALPVVCSELIEIATEDGMVSGRCGTPSTVDGMCVPHAAEMRSWLQASEAERLAWEKVHA